MILRGGYCYLTLQTRKTDSEIETLAHSRGRVKVGFGQTQLKVSVTLTLLSEGSARVYPGSLLLERSRLGEWGWLGRTKPEGCLTGPGQVFLDVS